MAILFKVSNTTSISADDVEIKAVRAQGPGGQNVNKTSTAIQLRYDINNSSLSEQQKSRLLSYNDYRISSRGIITVKAQRYRSQEQNKVDAVNRLKTLIKKALTTTKARKKTKPPKSSVARSVDTKKRKGKLKLLRQKPNFD